MLKWLDFIAHLFLVLWASLHILILHLDGYCTKDHRLTAAGIAMTFLLMIWMSVDRIVRKLNA